MGIAERVGVSRPTVKLARPLCRAASRAVRPGAVGPAAYDRPPQDRDHDVEAAAEEARGDALVVPAAGRPAGNRAQHGAAGVAGVRGAAVAVGDVQVLHRPGAGREGHRCRRACIWPRRRMRSCCVLTRSPRSRRWTGPRRCCRCSQGCPNAAPMTTSGTAPRPCSPRWRSPPAR